MKRVFVFLAVLILVGCVQPTKKENNKEVRHPSSTCEGRVFTLQIRNAIFVPAYDENGKSKSDVGTTRVFGKLATVSPRKVECTFFNESGRDLNLKSGTELEVSAHYRRRGPYFYDQETQLQVTCSEEGLSLNETIDWVDKEISTINTAMSKSLQFKVPKGC